ncbi:MAG: hypothetical protein RBS43_08745 [Candidatus Cloacimonas sp.]|jgi:hypothetical protein|nr:hypothetical protein [Candidatus Cloacimonas sp.]
MDKEKDELKGYSHTDLKIDIGESGISGVVVEILSGGMKPPIEEIEDEPIHIIPWKGYAKYSPDISQSVTPVFFTRQFSDLDKDTISKVKTFGEIQVGEEKKRGKRFGNSIEDKKELKKLYIEGDKENKGYLKVIDKKDESGTIYKKYVPEYDVFIGVTEKSKELLTESPHNSEVFHAVYRITYRYVLGQIQKGLDETNDFHYPIFGFTRISIKKDDIFNELGWDKNDRWARKMVDNGLYYMRKVSMKFEWVDKKKGMDLSPFFINYGTSEDGTIVFSANEFYFRGVEKHILRKINEIKKGESIAMNKGSLPPYVSEEPFIEGESPESHQLKMFIKTWLVDEGKTDMKNYQTHIPVESLVVAIGGDLEDRKHIDRRIDKLSATLDEVKESGFYDSYSPKIDKGYGRLGKSIKFKRGK